MPPKWLRTVVSFTHIRLRVFSKLLFIIVGCLVAYSTLRLYIPRNRSRNLPPIYPWKNENFVDFAPTDKHPSSATFHSVLVFLHIQKTGGTLIERGLVKSGLVGRECSCVQGKRRCSCRNPNGDTWLVSRFSTGWICGLHADLTEYTECLDSSLDVVDERLTERRYLFFTILRNPLDRYLSEWLHVRRGGTWHYSRLRCAGHDYSPVSANTAGSDEIGSNETTSTFYRLCYMLPEFRPPHALADTASMRPIRPRDRHPNWMHVPLHTFLSCPYNLAHNRQTRMLADLTRLGCYRYLVNWSQPTTPGNHHRDETVQRDLLASAKHALLTGIRAFGLSEHTVYTQYMLHHSLNITFRQLLTGQMSVPRGAFRQTHAGLIRASLNASDLRAVRERIQLDTELYRFARSLFTRRLTVRLVSDSAVPWSIRRPLRTLWFRRPSDWFGLEWLLLGDSSGHYSRLSYRLQKILLRVFLRQGSAPLTKSSDVFARNKWKNKLTADFAHAGLLTAVAGSLYQDDTVQIEEEVED